MDKTIQLTQNKSFEVQLSGWDATSWFDVSCKWDFKGDHCGPKLTIEIYNIFFCVQIYDHRHWNEEANRFYQPGEESFLSDLEEAYGKHPFTIESNTKL